MAPWWLRSSKDERYEDELDIDDKTFDSIAIAPEPETEDLAHDSAQAQTETSDEEAFAIGWEPGQRSDKPPTASELVPPALSRQPILSRQPVLSRQPILSRDPVLSRQPVLSRDPALSRGPVLSRDPLEEDVDDGVDEDELAAQAQNKDEEVEEAKPARKKRRRRRKKRKPPAEESTNLATPPNSEVTSKVEQVDSNDLADVETQGEIEFDFGPHERNATVNDERKIALFCDLENIALGVRSSETKKFDINLVIERLLEKGKIIVKRAYADWERYSDFKRTFHEAAIELIDIPQKHYSGKNSADIKMVVDAMDLCFSKDHLDTFVILSGDSDFSPLVSKLKENNKYVIGIGVKGSTSSHLIDNCDEFIYYEDVWRDMQRTPRLDHLSLKEAEVFSLLIESILALLRENKSILWGSMIKQTMQRKRPSFSEGYYGYGAFRDLLEDARRKNIILLKRDQSSGNYVVTGFGQ